MPLSLMISEKKINRCHFCIIKMHLKLKFNNEKYRRRCIFI